MAENGRLVVAAEAAPIVKKAAASSGEVEAKGEIFWMRDPKTGNWVPENCFGNDVVDDAVALRNKFLSKTHNNNNL